jgi:ABC-2 type transport system permease protein
MAISRTAVLAGHVLGNTVQTLVALVLVVGVGLLLGFRPTARPLDWLLAAGLLVLLAYAVSWLGVAMGIWARSVETASNLPLLLVLLPFLGSGFAPTGSMPTGLRWFAEHQPFTAFIEALRGLLVGSPWGGDALVAVGWCVVLVVVGYVWATALYERRSTR